MSYMGAVVGKADPEIRKAVRDFLATGAEIRRRRAGLEGLAQSSAAFEAETYHIAELESRIAGRAERLGIYPPALAHLIGDALDVGKREPSGRSLRIKDEEARQAVEEARALLAAAQKKLERAEKRARAASEAFSLWAPASMAKAA